MNNTAPAAIILAAGRGTRMKDNRTHKVCYEIAGRPAILRLIDNFRAAGVSRFVVVVGAKADKVMDCLDGEDGIVYAYQKTQNGTGNAAKVGLRALLATGYSGSAFVCMGDKIIAPEVFASLAESYSPEKGMVFAATPKEMNPSGGRILIRNGKVCGIIERLDTYLRKLSFMLPMDDNELRNAIDGLKLDEKKSSKLYDAAKRLVSGIETKLCGETFTPDEIEESRYVNAATYLSDARETLDALSSLTPDNAQGELYMTDAVNLISEKKNTETVVVSEPDKLLTYSTMEELLKLEKYFSPQKSELHLPTASELCAELMEWEDGIKERFAAIYGNNPELIAERREAYIALLNAFIAKYGDHEVIISRAPGRLNVMGRHIEHRGGSINVMTISREMLSAVSLRHDDIVRASNTDPAFADSEFSILDHIKRYNSENWLEYIESAEMLATVGEHRGEWINYIKAAVLRLQLNDRSNVLSGMDMMFSGNIPMAAGLSSSSSLVVATMEAALALNRIELPADDFIRLCGEGEWFVGSRGGAGDHAAMKCGRAGCITHLFFNPFSVGESFPFPEDYRLIVANSFIEAKKSAGAKDVFNSKIASYEFGLMLLKKNYPEYSEKMKVLKDVNPKTLSVPPSRIYEMLISLPERMTVSEVRAALPGQEEKLARIFKTHIPPESYDIRSVVLYGIAECERSEYCGQCLKRNDISALGRLMNTSHNGDRVWRDGKKFDYSSGELYLYRLINDLKSEDPERVEAAQLYNQPGGYACSTKEIDELADSILGLDGVLGVQLSGAGLGGCIMVLAKKDFASKVIDHINNSYYIPGGHGCGAEIFSVISGSGTVI